MKINTKITAFVLVLGLMFSSSSFVATAGMWDTDDTLEDVVTVLGADTSHAYAVVTRAIVTMQDGGEVAHSSVTSAPTKAVITGPIDGPAILGTVVMLGADAVVGCIYKAGEVLVGLCD